MVLTVNGQAPGMAALSNAVRATPPERFSALSDEEAAELAARVERAAADRDTH